MWGVASWSLLSGPLYGSGPAGGCSSRKAGWLVLWFPACVVGAGVVGCLVLGIRDTPAAAWLVVVGAPACVGVACCRGSGAVRPGCLACLGLLVVGVLGWVWVGWL